MSELQMDRQAIYLEPRQTAPSGLVALSILHRKPVEERILLFRDWDKVHDQEKEKTSQRDGLVCICP